LPGIFLPGPDGLRAAVFFFLLCLDFASFVLMLDSITIGTAVAMPCHTTPHNW
jgi:hypothetical protein